MAATAAPPRTAPNGFAHPDDTNWATGEKAPLQEYKEYISTVGTCRTPKPMKKKKVEDDTLLGSLCTLICDNQVGMGSIMSQLHVSLLIYAQESP